MLTPRQPLEHDVVYVDNDDVTALTRSPCRMCATSSTDVGVTGAEEPTRRLGVLHDERDELARARRPSSGAPCRRRAPAPVRRRARARAVRPRASVAATLEPVAHLPVHLNDDLDLVLDEKRGIGLRPRLAPTAGLLPSRPHSSSATCGAYGWISETAVSVANRAAGSSGCRWISLTSSITAAIGVWNENRRSMSSVTFAIVRATCVPAAPSPGSPDAASACSWAMRQRRFEEPPDPFEPVVLPIHVLVGRAHEERVHPHRVGAVAVGVLERVDDVALRLRHLGAARADHPLVEEPANGSLNEQRPSSFITFVKKRAYRRWSTACSMPPMYWLTGSQ